MTSVASIAAYLCIHYPYPNELSEARLVKMMYLADWRSSILHGEQLSPIGWKFNHYGPYTSAATEPLTPDIGFEVRETTNIYGHLKRIYAYTGKDIPKIPEWQQSILDFVIESTKMKTWDAFISLVYSTYPIATQDRYSDLNLPVLAEQYREAREGLGWNVPSEVVEVDPIAS